MNCVTLVGRLSRDPDIRQSGENNKIARFTLAVDRPPRKGETEKGADFVPCIAFVKTADILDEYIRKGDQIAIQGHIQTGSFVKADGTKVYTTDVVVDRLEFGKPAKREDPDRHYTNVPAPAAKLPEDMDIPEGFHEYSEDDEDIPF